MRATALLLTVTLAAFTASPGHAQIGGRARDIDIITGSGQPQAAPGWLEQRVIGTWHNDHAVVKFYAHGSGMIRADAYLSRGNTPNPRWLSAILKPNATKTALTGEWQDIGSDYQDRWIGGGTWSVSISNDRVVVDGLVANQTATQTLKPDHYKVAEPPLYTDWLGEWQVHGGVLRLFREHGRMIGSFRVPVAGGLTETRRELMFSGSVDRYEAEGDTLVGIWQSVGDPPVMGGEVRMTLLDGKASFGGGLAGDPQYGAWTGKRLDGGGSATDAETLPAPRPIPQAPASQPPTTPTPTRPAPVPQNPAPQSPQPSQPVPAVDGFEPLGRWDVRIDKVENPREDRLTHVYLTLRNAGTQSLLQTGDVWVYLETSDGLTQRSGQGVRAIPGPPQLFGSPPPVVLPGKEIKAKYVFDRQRGVTITQIMVMEGDHQAEFAF